MDVQPVPSMSNGDGQDVYAIKQIKFRRGNNVDSVGVLLQDVNGPCPIIALFNILLLRGNLSLPAGAGEVPVSRVVAMLAEYLLDKNEAMLNSSASESVKADLQYNLADAISLIPMLTTGIDVNVRFNDIKGVEYTNALCVFDLLGIDLVHGWLVDPQDVETAGAIRDKTYNEVAYEVITTLASSDGLVGGTANGAAVNGDTTRIWNKQQQRLHQTIQTRSDVPSTPPSHKASVAKEELTRVLESMDLDRFGSLGVDESPGRDQRTSEDLSRENSLPRARRMGTGFSSLVSQDSLGRAISTLLDETVSGAFVTPKQLSRAATMTSERLSIDKIDSKDEKHDHADDDAGSALVKSALVAKDFLENNSSQLTYYGISSLHEGLEEGQLAVFFRNNHFSTLLKHGGQLFILVTDQGYQNVRDIVWEQLAAVDNDTEFVGWDFGKFSPHEEAVVEFSDPTQEDADFKLAQQLQLEEDVRDRQRAEEERERGRPEQQALRKRKEKKGKKSSICSIM